MARYFVINTEAAILRDGKWLVGVRSKKESEAPGLLSFVGGTVDESDIANTDTLEHALIREVEEEVGLTIQNVEYLTSLATVHGDGNPSLVISCIADWRDGEVALDPSESDAFAWITVEEAKKYDLIDGIYDELVMAEQHRLGKRSSWTRGAVI